MTDPERYADTIAAMLAAVILKAPPGFKAIHAVAALAHALRALGAPEDEIRMSLAGVLLCDAQSRGPDVEAAQRDLATVAALMRSGYKVPAGQRGPAS